MRRLILFILLAPIISSAATMTPKYTRIFYYREGARAHAAFLEHYQSMDVLAPQVYAINQVGGLEGKILPDILLVAAQHKIKLLPLVTNKGFSQASAQAILDDETKQTAAIAALVAEAKKNNYWGWQVDFEQMDLAYRDKFSHFVQKFGEALHQNNLVSSVAVVAQVSDNPADYKPDLWQTLIGVYDYAALASSTDFVSLMSYDDPDSKGPVARFAWVKRVLDYSLKLIPPEKLSLGVGLYYWVWNIQTGKLVDVGGYKTLHEILHKYPTKLGYSEVEQAPFITYVKKRVAYMMWYENARSVQKKIELIKQYHLHGFSAWALGLEVPGVHDVVKKI